MDCATRKVAIEAKRRALAGPPRSLSPPLAVSLEHAHSNAGPDQQEHRHQNDRARFIRPRRGETRGAGSRGPLPEHRARNHVYRASLALHEARTRTRDAEIV